MKHPLLFDIEPVERLPDFHSYDWILVNSSGGKDSMTSLRKTVKHADECGFPRDRIVVVHADLGRAEWEGETEIAGEHAAHYGLRFEIVKHPRLELVERIRERGMFPSPKVRYCTSDFKVGPIRKLMTRLANESHGNARGKSPLGRPVRILNVLGLRSEESPGRAALRSKFADSGLPLYRSHGNSRRHVDDWLPIYYWTAENVWKDIRASGLRWHKMYDEGLPRLSCAFCFFASRDALMIAGELRPELLDELVEIEETTGHKFKADLSLGEIKDALGRGERADRKKCRTCPWAA